MATTTAWPGPTPLPHDGRSARAGFHVPYAVRECAFGHGLFATTDIPSGTLLWKIVAMPFAAAAAAAAAAGKAGDAAATAAAAVAAGCNVLSFADEAEAGARLEQLGASAGAGAGEAARAAQAFWMDHVYMFGGQLNEIIDDGKMWNHSERPCTGLPPASGGGYCYESSYSIRDIRAGEELLDDYGLYEYPEWYNSLCARFGVTRDFVTNKRAAPKESEWAGYGAGAAP